MDKNLALQKEEELVAALIGFALRSKELSSLWLGQGCAVKNESYRLQYVWAHAGRSTAPVVMTKSSDRP